MNFIIVPFLCNWILSLNNPLNEKTSSLSNNTCFSLANKPIVNNVTSNALYFKNGDLIELIVNCDQANYTILVNFTTIDDKFLSHGKVDYNNGTYKINYILNIFNSRPNGEYQITTNVTNSTSGLFTIYNTTFLTLDNTIPHLSITRPQNGTFISTNNVTIEGYLDATGSKIKNVTINDIDRFAFKINNIGETAGIFRIENKTPVTEGKITLNVTLKDSVDLYNFTIVTFTLDNTIPNLTGAPYAKNGRYIIISGYGNGTFSPITDFRQNISKLDVLLSPVGRETGFFFLANPVSKPLEEKNYILNITIKDIINFSNSLFIPFTIDVTPPTFDAIIQNVSAPEYYQDVMISIINPKDAVSGIKSILLYYSTNNGISWNLEDITQTYFGIIPKFAYYTQVIYRINITDNEGNTKTSSFSYIVTDTSDPVIGNIQQNPAKPTQFTNINISIGYIADLGSGIASIYLNYSINGGINWNLINITENQWGIIEAQPANTRILYQIIAFDQAGNKNSSELTAFIVKFDPLRLILIIIAIIGAVVVSVYGVVKIVVRRKQKYFHIDFLNRKEEFKTYLDLRLADIDIILNDIEFIESNLDQSLMYQWAPEKRDPKDDTLYQYHRVMEFIGITHISAQINDLKVNFDKHVQDLQKSFRFFKPISHLSQNITAFNDKLEAATLALGHLMAVFRKHYPIVLEKTQSSKKVEFPFEAFDQILARNLNEFRAKYQNFASEFDKLLDSKNIETMESRINEITQIFPESDEWLKKAGNWSKTLPLPKDRGYNYLLKLKEEQYFSIRNELELKVEKLRARLSSSITFAQNFINWNHNNLKIGLKKFETVIYEDALRFISSEETAISKIDQFIKEKFDYFYSLVEIDKVKIEEFYESHKAFRIQEMYATWKKFMEEIPSELGRLKENLEKFIQPLDRLFKLINGVASNFHKETLAEISKFQQITPDSIKSAEEFQSLNVLFSKTVWRINRIDNEINEWIDLLPFDLETPQLVILLRDWNEKKEAILDKLNSLSHEQKVYKCEIMHEILDPLNNEIWECSNCGAISCNEHLERWYHHKKAPECFKCGKTGTFKLKVFSK